MLYTKKMILELVDNLDDNETILMDVWDNETIIETISNIYGSVEILTESEQNSIAEQIKQYCSKNYDSEFGYTESSIITAYENI